MARNVIAYGSNSKSRFPCVWLIFLIIVLALMTAMGVYLVWNIAD